MRLYKSGTKWCIWRWTQVDSEYITRLHIIKTPWFAVCLHWINKPDEEPFLHDHPVSFLSFIIRGGYVENRNGLIKTRNWFNFIRASVNDVHRIDLVKPNTVTLCFMGPKVREWGFHIPSTLHRDKLFWVLWKDYYDKKRKALHS